MFANGRPYLAIPGPSVMPDRVLQAMHRPAPNIYTGDLHEVTMSCIPDLKAVARTDGHLAIYIGNGHAAWEAALTNVVGEGDRVLVPATGRFGHGWGEMAAGLGCEVEVLDFGQSSPVDPGRLEEALRADTDRRIKAVLAVHVDTSTGVKSDLAAMRAALDAAGHPALLMGDTIASLGCDVVEMDAWGVDVLVSACQKGLMTPPGLGFVWFNDRADAVRATRGRVSNYWDWVPRSRPDFYYQNFCGTAPTHHIYALRAALDMIGEEGLDAVHARHEALARALWAAVDAWGAQGAIRLNVADPAARSRAVTSIHAGGTDGDRLRDWCERQAGLVLGIGLGREPTSAWFRVGHMGHVNAPMLLGAIATMEAGLTALSIPHGTGAVEAATSALVS
ncbi:pyridoxal-phosphate-dependent aminotransferase family protein [Wenxinia saemankumensis]|uniref:Alanine-glyoxylate transaminase / serine-glyoxylate transaminase / serine-pyruvate transaminase n=1 Tax=Wenxinia saemankumensis TaxID=1447782 RepID=A0A1M6CRY0_9RHOB|nr:aminotransferase class V-fold PLP-dependent enzyme [Wenxinia saemankumensis]SHI63746.1 alanine-glyoxylate transaminase / serine-glyoxylate transaminase / serine-pyruvate transaminase [Wenxinia saemankumensis]